MFENFNYVETLNLPRPRESFACACVAVAIEPFWMWTDEQFGRLCGRPHLIVYLRDHL